jgi:CRISPR-associated protein Csd1
VGGNVETTLVGFNLDAFCSYGLKQSANAAVSTDTAETYAAALNQLIAEHSKRLAGAKVVYWYTHDVPPAADPVATLFNGVDFGEAEVQEEAPTEKDASSVAQANRRAADLLGAIDSGERADLNLGDCRYRALTLGGNAGRAVVRDWMEGSFEQLTVNVKQWFEDLSIVSRHGDGLAPDPKFLAVLGAMVRDLKEVHPPLETALWKSAVAGLPIPHEAMARTLARVRMDAINGESPRHARMGLLKAYLNRKARLEGKENHMTSALNTEPGDMIAYQFGRLIAVLSELQKEALRKTDGSTIKASIADRFYGSASTSPRTVHGQLIKLSQHHLRKLEQGGSRGKSAANAIRNRIAEISDNIHPRSLPTMFDLNEQSEFALGYYHQIAEQNRQRTAKSSKSDEQDTTETK